MPSLVLKPAHKPVKHYYAALQQLAAQRSMSAARLSSWVKPAKAISIK